MNRGTPPGTGATDAAARLVPLRSGVYAFALSGETGTAPDGALGVPALRICALPSNNGTPEIGDGSGPARSWLSPGGMLVARSPEGGGIVLATLYFATETGGRLPVLEVRPLDPPGPRLIVAFDRGEPGAEPRPVSVELVVHLSGRGDLRMVDPAWAGHRDPAVLIESFTLSPCQPAMAGCIEYKGLPATGAETPWLPDGVPCGTPGGGIPLLGFAVRQKAGAARPRLDCEYSGRFRSGAVSGPARNGAPCRSPSAGDPLRAIQVRITERPAR